MCECVREYMRAVLQWLVPVTVLVCIPRVRACEKESPGAATKHADVRASDSRLSAARKSQPPKGLFEVIARAEVGEFCPLDNLGAAPAPCTSAARRRDTASGRCCIL
jgi:hypothetical protein